MLRQIIDLVEEGLILSNDKFKEGFMEDKVNRTLPPSRQVLNSPLGPVFQRYGYALDGFARYVQQEVLLFGLYDEWKLDGVKALVKTVAPGLSDPLW